MCEVILSGLQWCYFTCWYPVNRGAHPPLKCFISLTFFPKVFKLISLYLRERRGQRWGQDRERERHTRKEGERTRDRQTEIQRGEREGERGLMFPDWVSVIQKLVFDCFSKWHHWSFALAAVLVVALHKVPHWGLVKAVEILCCDSVCLYTFFPLAEWNYEIMNE